MNFIKRLDQWIPTANFLTACNINKPFIGSIGTCEEKWVDYENSR